MILSGARIIDPANNVDGVGDLRLDESQGVVRELVSGAGERIAARPGERVIDCANKVVCPGLIDIHVHLRVPGQEYKEDLESGLRAAAAGGFTAVACMPNTTPFLDNAPVVRDLLAGAKAVGAGRPAALRPSRVCRTRLRSLTMRRSCVTCSRAQRQLGRRVCM